MPRPKGGLGRGLEALLPPADAASTADTAADDAAVQLLDVDAVDPNPQQPRQSFDDEELKELQDSIAEHGILQPVLVAGRPARLGISSLPASGAGRRPVAPASPRYRPSFGR